MGQGARKGAGGGKEGVMGTKRRCRARTMDVIFTNNVDQENTP